MSAQESRKSLLDRFLFPPVIADHRRRRPVQGCRTRTERIQGYESEFFWGFVSAGVSGFVMIWWLFEHLRWHTFAVFMCYRLAVGMLVPVMIAFGLRPATTGSLSLPRSSDTAKGR